MQIYLIFFFTELVNWVVKGNYRDDGNHLKRHRHRRQKRGSGGMVFVLITVYKRFYGTLVSINTGYYNLFHLIILWG